jgi:hypothetical protein
VQRSTLTISNLHVEGIPNFPSASRLGSIWLSYLRASGHVSSLKPLRLHSRASSSCHGREHGASATTQDADAAS